MRLLLAALMILGALPAGAVRPEQGAREEARRFGLNRLERPVRRGPRSGLKREFSRFNSRHQGRWKMRVDPRTGELEALSEGRSAPRAGPAESVARQFLREQRSLMGVDPNALEVEKESRGPGHRHVLYRQTYRGLPVEFARVKVHLDEKGSVIGANSRFEPDLDLGVVPSVSPAQAARSAEADSRGTAEGAPVLVVLPVQSTGRSHLAWKVRVRAPKAAWRYYVDARTGQILFRYNNLRFASGTITGQIYDVDPYSTPGPTAREFRHQWVYIGDASVRALTSPSGTYASATVGKVTMGLQGPYVNVANFRGASAHYDNGSGVWSTIATPVSSPHPYSNSSVHVSTIDLTVSVPLAVKVLPVFTSFKVGSFSGQDASDTAGGGIEDDDQLTITDGNGDRVASYIGDRGAFNGAAVAGKVMNLTLRSNEAGQQDGYDVALSSYLTVTAPGVAGAGGTESHVWTTAHAPIGLRGELSLFYHLNLMHDYFFNDVNRSSAAPVSRPVVAMAHVGPNMSNAFYNPDHDNLMFGDVDAAAPKDAFTEDATVTHHEYAHYLVEKIWSIQNFGQAGAISEAVADYFAGSSLNMASIGAGVLTSLGGTGSLRELDCAAVAPCKVLSNSTWQGEIHLDSLFLSQALWDIRKNRVTALGAAPGRSCVDGLVFQSLLFFPESFGEFYDAMLRVDADGRVASCGGAGTAATAINTAFGPGPTGHGLILGSGDALERNDGFETATDVSTRTTLSATIFPTGDTDFYSFGAGPGLIRIMMGLPASGGYYKGYQLKLFDRSHRLVAFSAPPFNEGFGSCEETDCITVASSVELLYNNATGGQFYLQVSGGDAPEGSASGVQSSSPYSLSLSFQRAAALSGSIVTASFDNDLISFNVDVTTHVSNQDWRFSNVQLRDHIYAALSNATLSQPPAAGDFLTLVSSSNALGRISGSVRLTSGFAARFPAAGTVHVEVFGYNVRGSTSSLGLSNPINLTAAKAELTAYNNVFNPARGEKATVKYAVLTPGRVVIKLYTLTGTFVKTLLDEDMPAGKGALDWDGRNVSGSVVASGIYLLRIDAPGIHKTQKIAIIK